MKTHPDAKDLVVLTADKNCQFAVRGILSRHPSLHIRPVSVEYFVHPGKDPGALRQAHEFLRAFARSFHKALVVIDREGCGKEDRSRDELEDEIESRLAESGWEGRAAAIVIDPELDIWAWSDSPQVDAVLHWRQRQPDLREWLRSKGFLTECQGKPARPKEALEAALREVRMPRSSAIYEELAEKVSLQKCMDPAFVKLKDTLLNWFPAP